MALWCNRQPNPERNEPTTRTENANRDMHRRPFEEGR
jgi:hypothetical protein